MTELELRKHLVDMAMSYAGSKEGDSSHKGIIDKYNSHKPLARGYKVKYTDDWCSTFVSVVAIVCGLTDIIPTECGCEKQIGLFKKLNSWQENDAYVPQVGDYIFYDWQDAGVGDCTGHADHVGIVVDVTGSSIKIIEGNMNDRVGYRYLTVNARYIRGYGVPKYSKRASSYVSAKEKEDAPQEAFRVGDVVTFTGNKHFTSSSSIAGKNCKPGKAKVTALSASGRHPVHLVAVAGEGSTVYGWVDTAFITRENAAIVAGARVKVNAGAKTYTGGKLASFVYGRTYDVLSINGDRVVIGIGTSVTAAVKKKDLTVV
jgi:hypothetical protein